MRKRFHLVLCFFLILTPAVCRGGEVIDRLVATVDRQPILQSDWEEALAFEALQQGKDVDALLPEERSAVLERMIDQQLLLGEMGESTLAGALEEKRVEKEVEEIRAQFAEAKTGAGWQAVLDRYRLTTAAVEERIRRQLQVLGFIDLRLRPEASVQREDVEDYYRDKFLPEIRRRGGKEENLPVVYTRIEEILRQQRIDELLAAWLHNLREQSNVQKFVTRPAGEPESVTARGGGGC